MVRRGDAWWRVSDATSDSLLQTLSKGRAVYWYKHALPSLGQTLDRLRANSRVQQDPERTASSIVERIAEIFEQTTAAERRRNDDDDDD